MPPSCFDYSFIDFFGRPDWRRPTLWLCSLSWQEGTNWQATIHKHSTDSRDKAGPLCAVIVRWRVIVWQCHTTGYFNARWVSMRWRTSLGPIDVNWAVHRVEVSSATEPRYKNRPIMHRRRSSTARQGEKVERMPSHHPTPSLSAWLKNRLSSTWDNGPECYHRIQG